MDYGRRVIIASLAITCELLSRKLRAHPHIRSVALKLWSQVGLRYDYDARLRGGYDKKLTC